MVRRIRGKKKKEGVTCSGITGYSKKGGEKRRDIAFDPLQGQLEYRKRDWRYSRTSAAVPEGKEGGVERLHRSSERKREGCHAY